MKQDKGPISMIKKIFSKDEHGDKKKNKYQYLILVLGFGVLIMLLSNMFFKDKDMNASLPVSVQQEQKNEEIETFGRNKSTGNSIIADYEDRYENQLKEALEGIHGVSDVTVVVNVDATDKKVLEKNTVLKSQTTNETDREGGKRQVEDQSHDEQLVIIRDGEKEVPIVIETKKPEIRGVLVVAKGAENIQVKRWIIDSVTRVLDVPMHRVAVMPKKSKGE